MKSEKGFANVKLVILCIVLMIIMGTTAHVVFQKNGIISREEENIINKLKGEEEMVVDKAETELDSI